MVSVLMFSSQFIFRWLRLHILDQWSMHTYNKVKGITKLKQLYKHTKINFDPLYSHTNFMSLKKDILCLIFLMYFSMMITVLNGN